MENSYIELLPSPPVSTGLWSSFAIIVLLSALASALLAEQLSYMRKKRLLPGPPMVVVPFLGSSISLILNPTSYWRHLAHISQTSGFGFCADYIVGRFIIFIENTELSHKIFSNVRPDAFRLIGHPFGKKLFGEHNIIYMFGQDHKDVRSLIVPNFTCRALSTYVPVQQKVILQHIARWLRLSCSNNNQPLPLRLFFRDMNLETSQTVFVGDYLSPQDRDTFARDYNLFNVGVMAMPIDLPGFAFRNARLAVSRLVNTLTACVSRSRSAMVSASVEPTCLVDFWTQGEVGDPTGRTADSEIGGYLFDFLFAAQDASTSSLVWAVALLESHPDVLAKVREEVSGIWSPHCGKAMTAEQLGRMKYTEAVAREVIRYRPPATLVPHVAEEEFPLTEYYTIPRGAIVFPSTFEASFQGFPDPERFDPSRFSEERQEEKIYRRNYLAFGAGPHHCVGKRYAINLLVLFVAVFVSVVDFKRHHVDGEEDEIAYVPTIVPKDDCKVYLTERCAGFLQL